MPFPHFFSRIISVGMTAVIWHSGKYYFSILMGITFAHYLVAAWFSRHQFQGVLKDKRVFSHFVSFLAVGTAGSLVWTDSTPYWLFGLHFIFSESFVLPSVEPKHLTWMRCGFAACIYAFLTRTTAPVAVFNSWIPFVMVIIFFVGLMIWEKEREIFLFECVGILAVAATVLIPKTYSKFDYTALIIYHVIYWAMTPIWKKAAFESRKKLCQYWLATLSLSFLIGIAIFFVTESQQSFRQVFAVQLGLWGSVHIVLSIFTSRSNPPVLLKIFR